ncbi:MAG TPA: hypothetical protein VFV80_13575 [Geminicoccaceae bacterium]|nr:hypothetical protein [Geminicoccaceae bacterium]
MRRTDRQRRPLRWLWLALGALAATLAAPTSGRAAALIEARINGAPLRLVADRAADRVLLVAGGTRALFDLAGGSVYLEEGGAARRVHAFYRPGHVEPPYRIELFGPGPKIAGYVTTYQVLFVGEQVCAELMTADWMTPFVDPAIRALALLQMLEPAAADPCQQIPFATYAATGWPLIAGKIDHPTIETSKIAFDYRPQPGELNVPASFAEGDLRQLRELAKAAGL